MTTAAAPLPEAADRAPRPVASMRHTIVFLAIYLGIAALIRVQTARPAAVAPRSHVPQYLSLLAMEWLLFYVTWRGLHRFGTPVREIVGGRWRSLRDVLLTIGIAAIFLLVVQGAGWLVDRLFAQVGEGAARLAETRRTMALMLPHGPVEIALWVLLSASAGFCEEFVFRGYLQRQLVAFTRGAAGGIFLAAVFFGLGHAYQGWRSVIAITVWGLLAGILAQVCRSLRPGMIGHAAQDALSGLFRW